MVVDWIALRGQRALEEGPEVWIERVHSSDIRAGVTEHRLNKALDESEGSGRRILVDGRLRAAFIGKAEDSRCPKASNSI